MVKSDIKPQYQPVIPETVAILPRDAGGQPVLEYLTH
jgi:hypothetical protein